MKDGVITACFHATRGVPPNACPVAGSSEQSASPVHTIDCRLPPDSIAAMDASRLIRKATPDFLPALPIKGHDGTIRLPTGLQDDQTPIDQRRIRLAPNRQLRLNCLSQIMAPEGRSVARVQAEEISHGPQRIDLSIRTVGVERDRS